MKLVFTTLFIFMLSLMNAQESISDPLPYEKIPDYPETYTAGTVVSRMIDGLGFRYYWATEGLREKDLRFSPGTDARSIDQTLDHILGLSRVVLKSAEQGVNDPAEVSEEKLSFEQKRNLTLKNLKKASLIFRDAQNLEDYPIIFRNKDGDRSFPFWNQINGPIEDAVWHTGQVVSLRRQAGNPFPSGVSVLMGIRRNQ
ncbi:MAG: hypothetical protein HKP60_04470 [Eudoraea sp.]|nr:hypothetical protein [Eudoraea sp.]NNJ40108.1 hypothetical protein [Eudoraea sp.]